MPVVRVSVGDKGSWEVSAEFCTRVERRLKCDAQSVPEARHVVSRALEDVGLGTKDEGSVVRDDALLIVTELLSNAVRVCREKVSVRVEFHRTWLEMAVTDDSVPHPPFTAKLGLRRRRAGESTSSPRSATNGARLHGMARSRRYGVA
jgi:anti-sigma regulatory factor (Ser/Thr protein kinase)